MAVIVATWPFSFDAVTSISDKLTSGSGCLDALEKGINEIEDNPETGSYFVGRGGFPNASGVLEGDAAVMLGKDCSFGAVAALQGVAMPFSVARCIMERSPHSMLVGQGAQDFAVNNGFLVESNSALQTQISKEAYEEFLMNPSKENDCHDTVGILVLDSNMQIAAGVSSSGMAFKHPGRVGDSPLPGSGLYADDEVGAAAATGDGDKMMRFCPSFHVVQLMKEGCSPQESCERIVRHAQRKVGMTSKPFDMALIALNKKGEFGAASTVPVFEDKSSNTIFSGFPFVVWTEQMSCPEIRVQPVVTMD
ncbi:N(4)-(Beta-N-acetylglucosaminyl)-L-asparaginase-like isoform X2 [Acropora muricata]|uniref:N(4)-(Beta-N-acetylglucosaminyl)-L-asparaginase- like isoform X2 n=1 Tax=Acropora muricata TaxID=159855 RepID=UPI0034E43159